MVDRYEWFGSLMQSNLDLLLADLVNVSWASFSVQLSSPGNLNPCTRNQEFHSWVLEESPDLPGSLETRERLCSDPLTLEWLQNQIPKSRHRKIQRTELL